jgi:hypothetical protein
MSLFFGISAGEEKKRNQFISSIVVLHSESFQIEETKRRNELFGL